MGDHEPEPSRSISRSLAYILAGTPGTLGRAISSRSLASAGPTPGHAQSNAELESVRELNREQVEDSRRFASAQRLTDALEGTDESEDDEEVRGTRRRAYWCLCIVVVIFLWFLTFLAFFCYAYGRGWGYLIAEAGDPCDRALKLSLLLALTLPLVVWDQILKSLRQGQRLHTNRSRMLDFLASVSWLVLWVMSQDDQAGDCEGDSEKDMRRNSRNLAIYGMCMDVLVPCIVSGFQGAMVSFAASAGPGPMRAARANLIDELPTVSYDADVRGSSSECPVCQTAYEPGEEIKRTPCKHFFHKECLGEWLTGFGKTCPICRADLEAAVDAGECETLVQP